ncbi:MAG: TerC/Alx family metal homeostasis membrane protein [Parachlamydiaceae bacterium]|nr:TerC/Alx family metal homeostasis membrane protein [Parachlamydiaceae bacterium]
MNIVVEPYHWIVFTCVISVILFTDLWLSYVRPHSIGMKEALLTSAGWISLALLFNIWIYYELGKETAMLFLTGYLLEESLSVDNLFIFLLIFSHFRPPENTKHKILFYGILSAIVMRGLMIMGGIALINQFQWIFYVFGIFLIYSGIKLAIQKEDETVELEKNTIYRWISSWLPMTHKYHDGNFIIKSGGRWIGTPLLLILVLIEITDLIFALDSVPAILGITTQPFIVYTSNIFAILGLRSLFFVLEGSMQRFYLLHYALSLILIFIGTKMLLAHWIEIPISITFTVLLTLLGTALLGSFLFPKKKTSKHT